MRYDRNSMILAWSDISWFWSVVILDVVMDSKFESEIAALI